MKDTDRKKKIVGVAAGAAAAATAVGIAAAKLRGRSPTVYHVRAVDDGWEIRKEGAKEPASRHGTKRQAVKEARDLAGGHTPSRLVIHRRDDTIQKEHTYEPE
jgi:hypothetical protein